MTDDHSVQVWEIFWFLLMLKEIVEHGATCMKSQQVLRMYERNNNTLNQKWGGAFEIKLVVTLPWGCQILRWDSIQAELDPLCPSSLFPFCVVCQNHSISLCLVYWAYGIRLYDPFPIFSLYHLAGCPGPSGGNFRQSHRWQESRSFVIVGSAIPCPTSRECLVLLLELMDCSCLSLTLFEKD